MLKAGKANVVVMLILLLLVAGGVVVFVKFGGEALTKQGSEDKDRQTLAQIDQAYSGTGAPGSKTKLIEPLVNSLHGETARAEQSVKLADLYDQAGFAKMKETEPGSEQEAEDFFVKGMSFDSKSFKIMGHLGDLYFQFAKRLQDLDKKREFYGKAEDWLKRSGNEAKSDPKIQESYYLKAAEVYYSEADELANANKLDEADQAARDGLKIAPAKSDVAKKLADLLPQIKAVRR